MTQQLAFYAGDGVNPAQARKWIILAMVAGLVIFSTGCAKLQSRDQMNQGVQAYRDGHYADAADHFKQAVQFDPTNKNALEYLATSYFTQWIPGAESADNKKNLQMAQQTFQEVLNKYPNDSLALATMAAIAYNVASTKPNDQEKAAAMEDARKWNDRRIQADPKDSEAYYYLGVIDFSESDPAIRNGRVRDKQATAKEGTKKKAKAKQQPVLTGTADTGPIKDEKIRAELKDKYGKTIDDGIADLHKALDIDNENQDAMSYIGLLLRSKAAIDDTPEEAEADIAKANQWADKSLATKKMKATRPKKSDESSS